MNARIADVVDSVTPLDCDAKQEARDRLDALTKPRGSLGRLEELAGITGRDAPQELIDFADLVTEMTEIKHPYERGVKAQPGLEF